MTVKQQEDSLKQWRFITPILLMVLSGILTLTGFCVTSYLGQINSSISSIGSDLKGYMKENSIEIHNIDTRVRVLEVEYKQK